MGTLLLALVAAAGYGVSDFVGGVAARRVAALRVVIVSYPLSVLFVAALLPFVDGRLTASAVGWGLAAGAVAGLAVWWFYLALAAGPMSVVSPVTAVMVVALPVTAGFVSGERPGAIALVGVVLALVAVTLVSRETAGATTMSARAWWLTAGAGVTFGVYFILVDRVGEGTGLWPLLANRVAASAVVLAAALGTGQVRPPRGVPLRLAVAAGALDVTANAALLYALQGGLLSLVSVVSSLYPAATVGLAAVVLGERTRRVQRVGLVLAAASVALIASQT